MRKLIASPAGRLAALVVVLAMALMSAQAAQAMSPPAVAERPVAHNAQGELRSRLVGTTASGQKVTGAFVPLEFI
jgi:hypothetical protein